MDFVKEIISKLDKVNSESNDIDWEDDNYFYIVRKIIWHATESIPYPMTEIIMRRKYKNDKGEYDNIYGEYDNICFYKFEEAPELVKQRFMNRMENSKYYGKPIEYDYQVYYEGYIFESYTHYHKRK